MSYQSKSIKEIVEMIANNEVFLPAIQRKFVWTHEQISSLFDSIMRGYPIGTFLLWFIKGKKKSEYTFYEFLDEYHERDKYLNKIVSKPIWIKDEIIGVLDGQQRLSSMYVTLQGTYAYKRPYARWDSPNAFPKRRFYLNLLKERKEKEGEDFIYEFKFLTDPEAQEINGEKLWFHVPEVLTWGDDPEIDEYYDSLLERQDIPQDVRDVVRQNRKEIKKALRILHQRLVLEKLINYFKITEEDLDNILDIFVRVNSGGTVLSKSDLLFSTIVAQWEEGRKEIETFLEYINERGDGFWFDNDFIMRSCLVLTDCPVLFKVRNFRKENIKKIKNGWKNVKSAIAKAVDLLVESGFNGDNLTSQNAVIPIAYYFMKNGSRSPQSKRKLRKYLIHALLKRVYGGQGDRVLSGFREALRKKHNGSYVLKQADFDLLQVYSAQLPGNRSLDITKDDVEEILEYRKGPYTFMVLSLLYPNLKFGQVKFHQDHIHPASLFTDAKLKGFNFAKEKREKWQNMKDRLPNLQLMEGKENESKNRTPFKDWLYEKDDDGIPNVPDIQKFRKDNLIPIVSLDLKDFETFYKSRKEMLRKEIEKVLI